MILCSSIDRVERAEKKKAFRHRIRLTVIAIGYATAVLVTATPKGVW